MRMTCRHRRNELASRSIGPIRDNGVSVSRATNKIGCKECEQTKQRRPVGTDPNLTAATQVTSQSDLQRPSTKRPYKPRPHARDMLAHQHLGANGVAHQDRVIDTVVVIVPPSNVVIFERDDVAM